MSILAYGEITIGIINDGTSVSSVDVLYYLSSSAVSLSDGSWSSDAPVWENGKYIWSKTATILDNGEIHESNPVCITGEKGSTGTGITSITEEYYLSTSKTEQVDGEWIEQPPAWISGKYIWTRSKIVWSNPTSTTYTTPICDSSWEAANDVKDELESQINEVKTTVSGVSSKVNAVEKNITNKVWQTDITEAVNNYDSSTVKTLRDRVTQTEQNIGGLTTSVSDIQTTVSNKADGSTVTELSTKVSTLEQNSESFKIEVSKTYVSSESFKNTLDEYSTTTEMNAAIEVRAEEIEQKVSANTGDITTLKQTSDEIEGKVENLENDVSTVSQKADSLEVEIVNARGDHSSLEMRFDSISSEIETAEGNAKSYAEQTVNSFKTNVIEKEYATKTEVGALSNFSSRNLLRNSKTLIFSDYGFTATPKNLIVNNDGVLLANATMVGNVAVFNTIPQVTNEGVLAL